MTQNGENLMGIARAWIPVYLGVFGLIAALATGYSQLQVRLAIIESQFVVLQTQNVELRTQVKEIDTLLRVRIAQSDAEQNR
jgi:hypothetical protein